MPARQSVQLLYMFSKCFTSYVGYRTKLTQCKENIKVSDNNK